MVMKIKNIFKKSSECKNTSKEKGSRKEVNDPQGLLGINKEPNYNNFLALFTVDNSPWDFYDKVGINIENDGFYFLHNKVVNVGGAYGGNNTYKPIKNTEEYFSYIEKAFKNEKISLEEKENLKLVTKENYRSMINKEIYDKKVEALQKDAQQKEKKKLKILKDKFIQRDNKIKFHKHSLKSYKMYDFTGFKYNAYSLNNGECLYLRKIGDKYRMLYIYSRYSIVDDFVKNEDKIDELLNNSDFADNDYVKMIDRDLSEDECSYIMTEIYNRFAGDVLKTKYDFEDHIGCYGNFKFNIAFKNKEDVKVTGNDYLQCRIIYDFISLMEKIELKEYTFL